MIEFLGRDTLLDTGPLLATLASEDTSHAAVSARWAAEARRCLTTEAVLVEATHLIRRYRGTPARVLELVLGAEIPVLAVHQPLHRDCLRLLLRYADMDYADATLVALAGRLELRRVFTLDRRGFSAYRGANGRPLEIVPLS